MTETDRVLIAGGGPGGLTLAIELARHGVPSIVFEELARDEYLPPPRTNLTNVRSMTLLRRWGIADDVRAASPVPREFVDRVQFATRLNGHVLYTFDKPFGTGGVGEAAPEAAMWAPAIAIDTTMRAHAETYPEIELRWQQRVTGFEQDEDGVTVDVLDVASGRALKTRGAYLVGCDGSRSTVRRTLDVRLEGKSNLRENVSLHILAPRMLEIAPTVGYANFYWLINPDACPLLSPYTDAGHWCFHLIPFPDGYDPHSEDDIKKLIYLAVGEEFPVEILNGGPWTINSVLASTFQVGRAFLVGDAAHVISPLGGFGMNLTLLDAADLAWKLAGVLEGWGGPRLLDAYTTERRRADRYVMDISEENAVTLGPELAGSELEDDDEAGERARERFAEVIVTEKLQEFDSLFAQLGYRYDGSPIVVDDGTEPPPLNARTYLPSAHPGCLAPHVWLESGVSLYDRFGLEFTLLVLDEAIDVAGFERAAEETGLPLSVVRVGDTRARELYEAPLALIRPDQHVAWRGEETPTDARRVIDTVRGA